MDSEQIIDLFSDRRVVVVGDAVADQFLAGTITRISREAPVFILRHDETTTLPGAAANAAANIAALGASVDLLSVIGEDENGDNLLKALGDAGIQTRGVLRSAGVTTPTKTRVLAARDYSPLQQVIRIDREPREGSLAPAAAELTALFEDAAEKVDAIVISDYGYGAVTGALFDKAVSIAAERRIPLVVDSRYRLMEFAGATSATPNREEVRNIAGGDCTNADCELLRERLRLDALLITNGNQGMTLFERGREPFRMDAVGPKEPVDVTGAGDTVIAAYSLALAAGMSFRRAAEVANHAGGIVVMKRGTSTVSRDELVPSLRTGDASSAARTR